MLNYRSQLEKPSDLGMPGKVFSGYAYECFQKRSYHFSLWNKLGATTFIQCNGLDLIHVRSGKKEKVETRWYLFLSLPPPSPIFSLSPATLFPPLLLLSLDTTFYWPLASVFVALWPSDPGLTQLDPQVLGIWTCIEPFYQLSLFETLQMGHPEMSQSPVIKLTIPQEVLWSVFISIYYLSVCLL